MVLPLAHVNAKGRGLMADPNLIKMFLTLGLDFPRSEIDKWTSEQKIAVAQVLEKMERIEVPTPEREATDDAIWDARKMADRSEDLEVKTMLYTLATQLEHEVDFSDKLNSELADKGRVDA